MDYGGLLKRSWEIIRDNKWLLLIGLILVVGTGGLGGIVSLTSNPRDVLAAATADLPPGLSPAELQTIQSVTMAFYIGALVVCVPVGIVLWGFSRVAAGGLIAGVNQIVEGEAPRFSGAWALGWQKGWRMIGIGLILSLPALLISLASALVSGPAAPVNPQDAAAMTASVGQSLALLSLSCLSLLVSIPLGIWQLLSEQACIQENTNVFESLGRAWRVFLENPGQVVVLMLIQFGIGLATGLVVGVPTVLLVFGAMLMPFLLSLLCCLVPLILAVGTLTSTYFYTLWTLAWREWTAPSSGEEQLSAIV